MKIDWYKQTKLSTGLLTLRRKAVRDYRVELASDTGLTYTQHTSLAAAKSWFDTLVELDRPLTAEGEKLIADLLA